MHVGHLRPLDRLAARLLPTHSRARRCRILRKRSERGCLVVRVESGSPSVTAATWPSALLVGGPAGLRVSHVSALQLSVAGKTPSLITRHIVHGRHALSQSECARICIALALDHPQVAAGRDPFELCQRAVRAAARLSGAPRGLHA